MIITGIIIGLIVGYMAGHDDSLNVGEIGVGIAVSGISAAIALVVGLFVSSGGAILSGGAAAFFACAACYAVLRMTRS